MPRKEKKSKKAASDPETIDFTSDKEILDYLKRTIVEQIQCGKINLKVGDLLKILEIQKKISSDSGAEEKFWELIEQIRQTELEDD